MRIWSVVHLKSQVFVTAIGGGVMISALLIIVLLNPNAGAFTITPTEISVKNIAGSPVAFIQLSDDVYEVNKKITFSAAGSIDPDGTISTYVWDFGDGTSDVGFSTTNVYNTTGKYVVTLTVIDEDSKTDSVQSIIDVVPPTSSRVNEYPIPQISAPTLAEPNKPISFSGGESIDPDGTISTYVWDFGDGTEGIGLSVSHEYANEGEYTVTLTVIDDKGATEKKSFIVNVQKGKITTSTSQYDSPIAVISAPTIVHTGSETIFSAEKSMAVASSIVEYSNYKQKEDILTLVSYEWTFGDGDTASGKTTSHIYENKGSYTVTLTVTNSAGMSETKQVTIEVKDPYLGDKTLQIDKTYYDPIKSPSTMEFVKIWGTIEDHKRGMPVVLTITKPDSNSKEEISSVVSSNGNYNTQYPLTRDSTPGIYVVSGLYGGISLGHVSFSIGEKESIIVIEDQSKKPVAKIDGPTKSVVSTPITFSGKESFDPDGDTIRYEWVFGDGATDLGNHQTVSHTYKNGGLYTVTLKVTDADGLENTIFHSISVTEQDESILMPNSLLSPTSCFEIDSSFSSYESNTPISFDAICSSDSDGTISTYEWNFGDGSSMVTKNYPITTASHTYSLDGIYNVQLTVIDNDGLRSDTNSFSIKVAPPSESADLVVDGITYTPSSPDTDDLITFTVTVRNIGTGSAEASILDIRVGGETYGKKMNVPPLAAGASAQMTRQETLSVAQNYLVNATADVTNVVSELDEGNNIQTNQFTVITPIIIPYSITSPITPFAMFNFTVPPSLYFPDLFICNVDVAFSKVTVCNIGTASAPAEEFRIAWSQSWYTKPGWNNVKLVNYQDPVSIPIDGQKEFVLSGAIDVGTEFMVDTDDNIEESNETNNCVNTQLEIIPCR